MTNAQDEHSDCLRYHLRVAGDTGRSEPAGRELRPPLASWLVLDLLGTPDVPTRDHRPLDSYL